MPVSDPHHPSRVPPALARPAEAWRRLGQLVLAGAVAGTVGLGMVVTPAAAQGRDCFDRIQALTRQTDSPRISEQTAEDVLVLLAEAQRAYAEGNTRRCRELVREANRRLREDRRR